MEEIEIPTEHLHETIKEKANYRCTLQFVQH